MTSASAAHPDGRDAADALRRATALRLRWLAAVVVLLGALGATSLAVGSRVVAPADVVAALGGARDTIGQAAVAARIPRTLLGALVGAALGLSGVGLQGVTRNPLAGPGILGISAGASAAVVGAIVTVGLTSATAYIWTAIVGAAVTACLVAAIGSIGRGGATPVKLALAGAAIAAACTSCATAFALPRPNLADLIRSWQIGGIGGATMGTIGAVLPFLGAGLALSVAAARSLDAVAVGEELATGLGERVALVRGLAGVGAVLLAGAATAVAGPIGFVGLVVPHVCRLLVGPGHRWLLPFAAVTGACLLLAGDVVGRVVARPSEVDVGVVTALLGAPWFIVLVRRLRTHEL